MELDVTYQQMGLEHIERAAALCRDEHWNVDFHVLNRYLQNCPQACYVAILHHETIGFCLANILNDDHAFICFFVVNKPYRGKGIGGKILQKTIEALGNRNLNLYSTPDAIGLYMRNGFKRSEPPAIVYGTRFEPFVSTHAVLGNGAPHVTIEAIEESDFSRILAYDTSVHIIPRHRFLLSCLRSMDRGVYVENSLGIVCGYALLEKKPLATKIFPLYADNTAIAEKLLVHIVKSLPAGEHIQVCIPSSNKEALDLFVQVGFSFVTSSPLELLCTKGRYFVPVDRVYSMLNMCNVFA